MQGKALSQLHCALRMGMQWLVLAQSLASILLAAAICKQSSAGPT